MWRISSVLKIYFVISYTFFDVTLSSSSEMYEADVFGLCTEMCQRIYPNESLRSTYFGSPRNGCQHGCDLMRRIQIDSADSDFSSSSRLCQKDCLRAYGVQLERFACNLGCFSRLIPSTSVSSPLGLFSQNSEDIEPDDVLLDPALRTQLKADESPIPHLHIRTLPHQSVEELYQQFIEQESFLQVPSITMNRKYWYDYFLTRMMLAAAIMLAVMCALWLCLVPSQNNSDDSNQFGCSENLNSKDGGVATPPPKYDEIVFLPPSSPPPIYSEVASNVV